MMQACIADILPQCKHEPGKAGDRYYASEPEKREESSSILVIDHGAGQYMIDLWSDATSYAYWEGRIMSLLDMLPYSSIYVTAPASFPWERLGYKADVLARRYRFHGDLKQISVPVMPNYAGKWLPAEGREEIMAHLLQSSDPTCPGIQAARQAVNDIYEGVYGRLLKGSGLVELEGMNIGGCLLSDEFGSILLSHIFTIPAVKRKGWARWLVAYGLHQCSSNPQQRIKASLDANNQSSYRLMSALPLQQVPEPIHVCRIRKEGESS
ncbi:hypothetical protein HUB98_19940 [Paenibacillus barcinonensis]|uniref:N-acetyltransferase domain-containing protein n=1 Tax=Paenibacillus barcinonensis TaxID=198119 RepID=A0A2V4W8C9_PAEBA|nr:hypothetical protein [Paenibacillus barcinonensis]PYE47405.1 hypothetical protein DFQ00_114147 [Paenibacillus barcinonensis]QKS58290.1 hypothetical protein HUB98_19940 [Paenibacillus barcinonensis]